MRNHPNLTVATRCGEFFATAHRVVKLSTVREPYRREILDETRADVTTDLARMEAIVRRGATFYLTPEGRYTTDGRMLPMRGVVERLAPHATIYLAGVSYDPFVSKRLSMLYRIVRFSSGASGTEAIAEMAKALAAIRPVTASQLLGTWLEAWEGPFTIDQAVDAVRTRLRDLPTVLFVDPELRRKPRAMVAAALPLMAAWEILTRDGDRYRLSSRRRHPQFPFVDDIISHQARFFEETLENVRYAPAARE